ncbi:PAS domain-containing sensor histidine kinase [Metabacillus fastidiosus]|uniref:PAS domain-containing sensor histidine kinase n=1 Tax=Metabacillus fastidiosus TaxID=1458 RepID=UPI002DBF1F8E|nr:PAS domain-containing sensor histidine kinase [Metabacillus fastidiosus]MEC2074515.1 PAS domain-containing sensor histidine kinase [Metabacillus fastidiosus]
MQPQLRNEYLEQIYEHIQDGIIVMRENREIVMMNPAAKRLTGWLVGEFVPYCSYCMTYNRKQGEPTCYLIANNEVPSFLSEMPTYHGKKIDVEMSTAAIYSNEDTGETEYLLVLRDRETFKRAEESAMNKKMIRALIEAQESEHKYLARELHDGVGQSLFSISLALQAIEAFVKDNSKLNEYISEVRTELQKVMNDVNSYSYRLRPHSLDQLGLEPTLQTLIDNIHKRIPGLQIKLTTEGLDRSDPSVEINLYRITQEALHNITKYAKASNVHIHIKKDNTHIYMLIKDNGIGFDRKKIKSEGLGLKHMEERADQLNGTCKISSKIGEGTCIDIVIPRWRPKHD